MTHFRQSTKSNKVFQSIEELELELIERRKVLELNATSYFKLSKLQHKQSSCASCKYHRTSGLRNPTHFCTQLDKIVAPHNICINFMASKETKERTR